MSLYDRYLEEKKTGTSLYTRYKREKYLATPRVKKIVTDAETAKKKSEDMSSPLGILKGTVKEIPNIPGELSKKVDSFLPLDAIRTKTSELTRNVNSIFNFFKEKAPEAKDDIVQWAKELPGDVWNEIKNVDIVEALKPVTEGIKSGIEDPRTLEDIKPTDVGEPLAEWLTEEAPKEIAIPAVKGYLGEGLYEKIVEPVVPDKLKGGDSILSKASQIAGEMTAFVMISNALGGLMANTVIGKNLIQNSPKIFGAIKTTGAGLTSDQLKSPLNATFEERKDLLASGIPKWLGVGFAGGVSPEKVAVWLPTVMVSQYTSSKLQGKSDEEAFDDAVNMAAVFAVFKIGEGVLMKSPEQLLREQASKTLGVNPTATPKEIKDAYYKMAQETHPDKPGGSEQAFKNAKTAYDVLSSGEKIAENKDILDEIKNLFTNQQAEAQKLIAGQVVAPTEAVAKVTPEAQKGTSPTVLAGKVATTPKSEIAPTAVVPTKVEPVAEVKSLEEEAKKYKSAEEFIKNVDRETLEVYKQEKINKGEKFSFSDFTPSEFKSKEEWAEKIFKPQLTDIYNKAQETKPVITPKKIEVPQSQLPVGEGKERVSKLEARIKGVTQNVSQDVIDKLGLSTYKAVINKENVKKAAEYVTKNPEEAIKVLQGEIEAPEGILNHSILVAMQNNPDLPYDLATKVASLSATRYGQEISVLREIDPNSPTKIMNDVYEIRKKKFEKLHPKTTIDKVKKDHIDKGKSAIKTPSMSDWKSLIDQIIC